jgi:hypothetical protein
MQLVSKLFIDATSGISPGQRRRGVPNMIAAGPHLLHPSLKPQSEAFHSRWAKDVTKGMAETRLVVCSAPGLLQLPISPIYAVVQ